MTPPERPEGREALIREHAKLVVQALLLHATAQIEAGADDPAHMRLTAEAMVYLVTLMDARSIPLPFPREEGRWYDIDRELLGRIQDRAWARLDDPRIPLPQIEAVLLALEEIYGGE